MTPRSFSKSNILVASLFVLTLTSSCASPTKVKKLESEKQSLSAKFQETENYNKSLSDENKNLVMGINNLQNDIENLLQEKAKLEEENKKIPILEKQLASAQNKTVPICPSNAGLESRLSKCEADLEKRQGMLDVCTKKKNQCITAFDKISKSLE